ncbi:MAG: TonB-dependent receptor, partial [Flavobacteriales bacterium]|nr:TonB-dependent receptor [Flavobacteriales bacterium]
VEDIDIEAIGKIEIFKGPNSSSYGSGLGGVISMYGKETAPENSFGRIATTVGSFCLLKKTLSAGYNNKNSTIFASYNHLESDGFRDNSSYDRKSFNLHGKQKVSANGTLNYIGIFTKLKAFIPSSINETDFNENPEIANANWAAAQGFESYDKLLLGIGYTHKFSERWSLESSIFSNFKDAYEPRPFNILDEKTSGIGFRSKINYSATLFSLPFKIALGSELLSENHRFSLIENLYQSQPGQGSIAGDTFSEKKQKRNYYNLFLQADTQLAENLQIETGVSLNSSTYTTEDVIQQGMNNQDGEYSFGNILSPRVGLSYKLVQGKNIYTSVSKGFSIPSLAETLTPEGEINTDLKPEIGINYEIGFKFNWLANSLYTEVAFYSTQISNLLVARRVAEDQFVGINAGESEHRGIEFLANYTFFIHSKVKINPYLSGTINDFKFKDFVDDGEDFTGNKITGVPNLQWNFGMLMEISNGFSFNASYINVGKIPMNDQNSLFSDSYQLIDVKGTYIFRVKDFIKTELSFGVNNVFNEKYAASILPNAVGFGNALPRYYYPGNPRNVFGGISINYLF